MLLSFTTLNLSIDDASKAMRGHKLSPVDLTRACLNRFERLNPLVLLG